jgi:hypothetical protein
MVEVGDQLFGMGAKLDPWIGEFDMSRRPVEIADCAIWRRCAARVKFFVSATATNACN